MNTIHGELGLGWQPDLPDFRDYHSLADEVQAVLSKSRALKSTAKTVPAKADLRPWCSPIENQGSLGSCTAHAGVGMVEYYERRTTGKYIDASRLFLYKVTRNLLGWTGDDGAYLRETMKALVLFGVPPEKYWPYKESQFNNEPTAFLYSFAQSYQAIKYYRLDPPGSSNSQRLATIKHYLAAGMPCMFGFSVYSSIPPLGGGADIPYPQQGDKLEGGHAVLAVGYDDAHKIGKSKGALLIRNSWGTGWGDAGYGWLPYDYVLNGLADDFWSMTKQGYVDTDLFK